MRSRDEKRDDYGMPRLLRAQGLRQAVLDFLHAHPWSEYPKIVSAVVAVEPDINPNSARGIVAGMLKKREIEAEGQPMARRYMALVQVTESAEEARAAYLLRLKIASAANAEAYAASRRAKLGITGQEKPSGIVGGPGSTVYREGQNPEIGKNSRGQGAAGGRSAIGSGMYSNPKW